jgi:hypothetical protein
MSIPDQHGAARSEPLNRRRALLPPIITKFIVEARDYRHQNEYRKNTTVPDEVEEVSRWSSSTDNNLKYRSEATSEADTDDENNDEKLERHKRFFNNRPLMKCLDTDDDQVLGDLLFERLLKEVECEVARKNYRGELQVRAFWDNLRMQLRDSEDPWSIED